MTSLTNPGHVAGLCAGIYCLLMRNRTRRLNFITRTLAALILSVQLFALGCNLVRRRVETERLLTPLSNANTSDLISAVNKLTAVRSIHCRVDIQFEDTSFASSGMARHSPSDHAPE